MFGLFIILGLMVIALMFFIAKLNDEIEKLRTALYDQNHVITSNQFDLDLMKKKLSHQSYLDRRI